MIEFVSKILKTDVTCVRYFKTYILAGIGNNLHIFSNKGNLLQIYPIFQGQKIHGIEPNSTNKIVVFGGKIFKIVEFDFISTNITKDLITQYCKDWIFAIQWLDFDTQIATIFANNFISLWSVEATLLKSVTTVECQQRCMLYSACLVNDNWDNLLVLSGTIFGHILIWKPAEYIPFAPVLYRLEGHDGAIFSITYSHILNKIVTTSDDRTVRIWDLSDNFLVQQNESSKIMLKYTMYGHIARVFKCKIAKNLIITAGEDSFVHIWNFDGELVRKFETHQGGCVWALDYSEEEDYIVSGGGDSGISLFALSLTKNIETLPEIENDTLKSLKITADNNIVIITNNGWLKYYKVIEDLFTNVQLLEDLKSYSILEISFDRKIIALAGFHGTIHIYQELENELSKMCSFKDSDSRRILSLCWLNNIHFLTSTLDGVMNIWILKYVDSEYKLEMEQKFILPPCKERWATCATNFNNCLVVGDRKGNIHLYELKKGDCIQTVKKAHCHLGVTSLLVSNNSLFSLGRNGILNKYYMDSSSQLIKVSNDKLPFSWLSSMIKQNDINLVLGFSGSNFIIYNLSQRRIILELNCGGGHRSWDTAITNKNLFYFYFLKEKRLHKFCEKWTSILTQDLVNGFHTKEINCGTFIQLPNDNFIFISGGEDTTLRLSLIDIKFKYFNTIYALKSHLSSIRCVSVCNLENNTYLIFSGGGRAQIIMHKLQIPENKIEKISYQQVDSHYKQLDEFEAETRIMDFAFINLDTQILLIAGTSDGTLQCYAVNKDNLKLQYIDKFSHTTKCIIKLSYLKILDHHVVISMATDGKLIFWDFTKFCINFEGILNPFYVLQANQSGINSFCFKKLINNTYLFSTGGDDNAIILNVVSFGTTNNLLKPTFICNLNNSKTHGAQITGIFIKDSYLITISIDQHISVLKYIFENNNLKCELLSQYCSTVADVQGMFCTMDQDNVYTCIYGKGVEILLLKNFN